MKSSALRRCLLLAMAALLCLSVGCGAPAANTGSADPAPTATAAPAPTPTETPIPDVKLGDLSVSPDAAELDASGVPAAVLLPGLTQLSMLERLELGDTELSAAELAELAETYPQLDVHYSVSVLGKSVPCDAQTLDLGGLTAAQLPEALSALERLSALEYVELVGGGSPVTALSMADVKAVQQAAPNARVNAVFDFYGQAVSTLDERVEFDGVEIGQENAQDVRDLLDVLQCCSYFKLADAGIDNETMADIRDSYPDTKVVWRVYFGEYFHCLTDEESIRAIFALDDTNCENLKYCTDVKYMDIGHDDNLSDVSFVAYMPKLEICIVSGSQVEDISYFANCPELQWLELVWCGYVKDLSGLENCKKLAYLNICYTQVKDLSPLDDCPLERFMYYVPKVDSAQQQEFIDKHPDCWTNFDGENPYVLGWRYNDQGYTWCDMYLKVREVFDYAHNYYNHS